MDRQESDTVHERMELLRRPGVMDVLRGSIQDLPHLPSNTVRIFLSSTFSGMLLLSLFNYEVWLQRAHNLLCC